MQQDTEGDLNGVMYDGFFIEEHERGVKISEGDKHAIMSRNRGGFIDKVEGDLFIFPSHVMKLVAAILDHNVLEGRSV